MILWRLLGHASEFVCSLEECDDGCRLVVRRGAFIETEETLEDQAAVHLRALALRDELLAMGFRLPESPR